MEWAAYPNLFPPPLSTNAVERQNEFHPQQIQRYSPHGEEEIGVMRGGSSDDGTVGDDRLDGDDAVNTQALTEEKQRNRISLQITMVTTQT